MGGEGGTMGFFSVRKGGRGGKGRRGEGRRLRHDGLWVYLCEFFGGKKGMGARK